MMTDALAPVACRAMPGKPLRIAWLGPTPGGSSGVRGVAAELLLGLSRRGPRIVWFFPAAEGPGHVKTARDQAVAFGRGQLAFGDDATLMWGTSRSQAGPSDCRR